MFNQVSRCGFAVKFHLPEFRRALSGLFAGALLVSGLTSGIAHGQGFVPPQNTVPGQSAIPTLDSSYTEEAWLVYTYDIDTNGEVANATIRSSNGVAAVEQKILDHLSEIRFTPGTRDGRPVRVSAGPVVYTWILDVPREMTDAFNEVYQEAWGYFKQQDYDQTFESAAKLKNFAGRNAYEEVRLQILAASLASRWEDESTELAHLMRIVEFQSLADKNGFRNPYVEDGQYLLILERIHAVQLKLRMLADGEVTLNKMRDRDGSSEVTARAEAAHQQAQGLFDANPDVTIQAELIPVYREGQGLWETRLSRTTFSISDIKGTIVSLYLSCKTGGDKRLRFPSATPWVVPEGWQDCALEVAGRSGTRFIMHQLTK